MVNVIPIGTMCQHVGICQSFFSQTATTLTELKESFLEFYWLQLSEENIHKLDLN